MVDGTFSDEWFSDVDGNENELPFLTDGKHVGMISKVCIEDLPYKVNDRNPNGRCLCVTIEKKGFKPATDQIPIKLTGIIQRVCRAAGIDGPSKGESFDAFCERLQGKSAPFESLFCVAQSGTKYVRLDWKYEGVRVVERRKEYAKAKSDDGEKFDDIPF